MLSSNIKFYVKNITDEILDINGYKYIKCIASVPGVERIACYISEELKEEVKEDSYYSTSKAYLTSLFSKTDVDKKDRDKEICFRIDSVEQSTSEKFNKSKETTVNLNGLVYLKSGLIEKGPTRIPTVKAVILVKNEYNVRIYAMLVAFYKRAKKLIEIHSPSYLDITGVLCDRKDLPCSISVKDFIVRKEVES